LQDLSERRPLVGGSLVIGFDDTIPNPVTGVARFIDGSVVEPQREIGFVFIGNERCFDFLYLTFLDRRPFKRIGDVSRYQLSG
jgi:hypothetical protein